MDDRVMSLVAQILRRSISIVFFRICIRLHVRLQPLPWPQKWTRKTLLAFLGSLLILISNSNFHSIFPISLAAFQLLPMSIPFLQFKIPQIFGTWVFFGLRC
ncbi:hypothetical protein Csa_017137 [Cucumis sativus]|uniref:Uncharacterized protein n=1 Tax=Cucumis sativus TaxID=3659 RepID=A0A0A0K675_CUCSA|nr:hypothetical protein Csa_017137 [Cucumis sativus]